MFGCDGISTGEKPPKESGETMDSLFTKKYGDIAAKAHQLLRRERPNHTLQTNALVHEAYFRMSGRSDPKSQNNSDILLTSVGIMRQVLIDHARKKRTQKRGGHWTRVELRDEVGTERSIHNDTLDILALDKALKKLSECDPLQARIVEQRYFTGMTIEQTANELELSPATVKRKWIVAQAWLYRELQSK